MPPRTLKLMKRSSGETEMIREAELVFMEIVNSVQYISEQIAAFSKESESMLESAKSISSAIQNISAITRIRRWNGAGVGLHE